MRDIEVVWTFMLDYMRGWGIREHSHDFYQMYYVVSGEADMLLERQELRLYPHLCLIIEPGQLHELPVIKAGCLRIIDTKFYLHNEQMREEVHGLPRCFAIEDSEFETALLGARNEWQSNMRYSRAMANALFEQAFYLYIRKNGSFVERNPFSRAIDHIIANLTGIEKRIADYASAHFAEDFTLGQLADELKYNKNYLCKVFKQATNFTIVHYVNYLRVCKAYELICYSGYSLTDISALSGFSSVHYFTQVFKKVTGKTPGEMRELEKDAMFTAIQQHGKFSYRYYGG
ncbi:AraC family transcriptional regulator [Agathobaculum sp. NTUH-O15-33]|uniref:helix-turn-helix transcriptional regulator n=1 Tax=Agathobaculum sp. NTUH-O15-33 TaxID=3079302 RepID=UPI002958A945|nr:AraC family transcriptional regulator [Agathobaculum sp. NTUH-O15-33]WNX84233.1 AraC family transcriptional regulator [Agathobaculum sp. NTUH-O15-33]